MAKIIINQKHNIIVVVGVILVFAISTWYIMSSNNRTEYFKIRDEIQALNIEVVNIKQHNEELKEEINKLKNDKQYLEDVVRREYGFLKKNEMVFDFDKKRKKKKGN